MLVYRLTLLGLLFALTQSPQKVSAQDDLVSSYAGNLCQSRVSAGSQSTWACTEGRFSYAFYSVPESIESAPGYYNSYNTEWVASPEQVTDICRGRAKEKDPNQPSELVSGDCSMYVSYFDPNASEPELIEGWFSLGDPIEGGVHDGTVGLRVAPQFMVCQCNWLVHFPG
jgi:hypothetical protein